MDEEFNRKLLRALSIHIKGAQAVNKNVGKVTGSTALAAGANAATLTVVSAIASALSDLGLGTELDIALQLSLPEHHDSLRVTLGRAPHAPTTKVLVDLGKKLMTDLVKKEGLSDADNNGAAGA